MKNFSQCLAVVVITGLASLLASNATASSITIAANTSIWPFGEPLTATFGQTFTALPGQLDQFSFWLDDDVNTDFVDFAGYVMAWDGSKATGSVLYSSTQRSTTNNSGAGGFEQFDFLTGGLSLVAGNQYVAFLSASNFFDGVFGAADVAINSLDPYTGGTLVFNPGNFGALTTSSWSSVSSGDAQFFASFSDPAAAVPEPASLILLGSGLVGIGARRYRRRT